MITLSFTTYIVAYLVLSAASLVVGKAIRKMGDGDDRPLAKPVPVTMATVRRPVTLADV